ncbi:SAM-dependent methyltransferase [Posidoniimonas corsicana]|uniref:SAM-dependent methyltransferase n=1 Tax=Posidoniimonas corsicana TaxID=1938618 RepID=UPI0018D43D2C|nr:cyclopropane-fatty-acyl-phospholipid synthase family protein [Posidoniimonas corsicana]
MLLATGGANGAAEAYLRGYWDTPDLTRVLRVMARNLSTSARIGGLASWLVSPLTYLSRAACRNTVRGSRRNIAAHYDLSNEFFELMLDPTMTYSCGVFEHEMSTLEEASLEKYDRLCRLIRLSDADHVLEIGTGWGGFAEFAVERYGCRVTTTTISKEQHAYASKRLRSGRCAGRVNLLQTDYRELTGEFDKLVSIEMIEAVGEQFLPEYFAKCSSLLRPQGAMALQAITIPDQRYDHYRRGVDFIQKYIFPGGFLPSIGKIASCIGGHTDMRLTYSEDFSRDYAQTLAAWRGRFSENRRRVLELGFDQRFLRMWEYYLCYCEAGFLERKVGVHQLLYSKPLAR